MKTKASVLLAAFAALVVAGSAMAAAKPKISSFSPTSGAAGTSVTIKGSNFSGATAVKFNTTSAQTFTVDSSKQVTAVVAAGTTSGKVSVTTPGGTASSTGKFKITTPPAPPTPQITSFTPTTSAALAPVVINGAGFTGATGVSFNGTPAQSYTVLSDTQIKAWLADHTTSGPITVTIPGGTLTSPSPLTVAAVIELSVCQRQPNTVFGVFPGTAIWLGTGWLMSDDSFLGQFLTNVKTTLTVNGVKVKNASAFWDTTGLPSTPSGWHTRFNYDPHVTMTTGSTFTASFHVIATKTLQDGLDTYPPGAELWPTNPCNIITMQLATIASFSPTSGQVGTPVTITGDNFVWVSGIKFGDVTAPITHVNNQTLTTEVPAGAASGPITLIQARRTIESSTDFTVTPPPPLAIDSIAPSSGTVHTSVALHGSGFLRVTSIKFGGTDAAFSAPTSDTVLNVRVPSGAHTGPITISDGTDTAESDTFTVFTAVGVLDAGFSDDGLLDVHLGSGRTEQLRAMTVDGDDRIVAVGMSTAAGVPASSGPAITRLLPDGTLDPTFDGDGKLIADLPSAHYFKAGDVTVDDEGRILVSGSIDTRDGAVPPDAGAQLAVIRFLADGSLDTSFGTGGLVTFGFLSCGVLGPVRVALQDDGKIVASAGACFRTGIVRFDSDGTLDTSFDNDGWVLTGPSSLLDYVGPKDLLIQPDGKILVAGGVYDSAVGNKLFVVRVTAAGAPDATFATGGTFATTAPESSIAFDLAVDSTGRIVIAGSPLLDRAVYVFARLTSGGTLDATFGTAGWTDTSFQAWVGGNGARAMALATDGDLLATGAALAGRWTSDGVLDSSFGTDGRTILGGTNWIDAALLSDGSLVVGGYRTVDNGFFFARLVTGRTVVP